MEPRPQVFDGRRALALQLGPQHKGAGPYRARMYMVLTLSTSVKKAWCLILETSVKQETSVFRAAAIHATSDRDLSCRDT